MTRGVLLGLVMVGCWTGPVAPSQPEAKPITHKPPGLEVVLEGSPLQLTMATRKDFKIKFVVTNHGETVVDPKLHESDLTINGASSIQWGAATGNGAMDDEWDALPPQHVVSREYVFGEHLFLAPGDFTLVLHVDDLESAPLHVHVAP